MKFRTFIPALALGGCQSPAPEQTRNAADPAVAEALSQPLMTDLDMQGAAAPDALRPSDQPATMQIPTDAVVDISEAPMLGQLVTARIREPAFAKCNPAVRYSAQWSLRLPDWIELPDGAHLAEAAGSDSPACALRIIRFGMSGTPALALDHFAAAAKHDGFAIQRSANSLSASRALDGAAFRVDATVIASGTRIDAVSNRGR
ncbi:hypothetical protein BH09PSE3_BH09PSE3_13370 [soil metagenome]